jgi:hypothetical protein
MAGDTIVGVLVVAVLLVVGIAQEMSKRARRDEVLPPGKVRELTSRLTTSHENLRKRSRKG